MRRVDECPVCKPINDVLEYFEDNNFSIVSEKLDDYHFHQLYFKLKGKAIQFPIIEKIKIHSETLLMCECHWSKVELDITPAQKSLLT
jgi:hypothetical protein